MTLTIDTLLRQMRDAARPIASAPHPDPNLLAPYYRSICPPAQLGSMRIISDPNCLKESTERLFPASRHRSARVRKKLIKRFGGEFRKVPATFKIGDDTIVTHPFLYQRLCQELGARP